MLSAISKWILRCFGWKIEGHYPHELKKFVIIVIPHTSNWDFPLGVLVRSALKAKVNYVGKDVLFRPPFGWLFRWLGGYPVNRSKSSHFVDNVVDIFNKEEQFALTIAPEGTRRKVEKLKSGFYYIALGARVPIVMIKFDWGNRIVGICEPFYPTGNFEADMEIVKNFYRGVKGKNPQDSFL